MIPPLTAIMVNKAPEQVAALVPQLQDLLHAAGWLYPCFMPSSRLPPHLQHAAMEVWITCLFWVNNILFYNELRDMANFVVVLKPCRRPQVPGGSCC
jgi:hypothetical protein